MKKQNIIIALISLLVINTYAGFGERVDCGELDCAEINEASGIAASRVNTDVLYVHNDSGDKSRIFAINKNALHIATIYLENIVARDWEDIAVGPGPEDTKSYIYISETGDNDAEYDEKIIYRIEEPLIIASDKPQDITVSKIDIIKFRYADGRRDAEALMVDPKTCDAYVISKREMNVRVYRMPYPQSLDKVSKVKFTDTLKLSMIVAADISPDGSEILMKDYHQIYYWKRSQSESVSSALKRKPQIVPYIKEPQGESVCWAADGRGYFTISETKKKKKNSSPCHLYFYPAISE